MNRTRAIAAAAVVLALMVVASPAQAAVRPTSRGLAMLIKAVLANPSAQLTPAEADLLATSAQFDHYTMDQATGGQTVWPDAPMNKARAAVALATQCYHHRAITYGRNAVGVKLYSWAIEGTWCGDGLVATSATWELGVGDTYYPFWTYKGIGIHGARVTTGSIGTSVDAPIGRIFGQGRFNYAYKGTIQQRQPCLRINGFGGGTYRDDYRCSYYD